MTAYRGMLVFAGFGNATGRELLKLQGGTVAVVADINPGPLGSNPSAGETEASLRRLNLFVFVTLPCSRPRDQSPLRIAGLVCGVQWEAVLCCIRFDAWQRVVDLRWRSCLFGR